MEKNGINLILKKSVKLNMQKYKERKNAKNFLKALIFKKKVKNTNHIFKESQKINNF